MSTHDPSGVSQIPLVRHEELLDDIADLQAEADLLEIFDQPPEPELDARIQALKAEADALLPQIPLGETKPRLAGLRLTLDLALQKRAPKFRAELEAKGQLMVYLGELADDIKTEVGRAGMNKKTQALPYLQKVQAMNTAAASAREIALADAIDGMPIE